MTLRLASVAQGTDQRAVSAAIANNTRSRSGGPLHLPAGADRA
jgi:hypothetical protein